MSSLLVILFGVVKHFVGSESGQKQSVKFQQNMVYNTFQHPPPHNHTLSVYCTFCLGRGEGGREVREKVEGQQYTSIVPWSMGATVRKIPTMSGVNVSPVYEICYNAAKSVNRSILKKSRHIGFVVFIVH
jgi:hypothetical protein